LVLIHTLIVRQEVEMICKPPFDFARGRFCDGASGLWRVYDRFYDDDRVTFSSEPAEVERSFRERAAGSTASPKAWADAWLLAVGHPVAESKARA
jgi:hypothetical protein